MQPAGPEYFKILIFSKNKPFLQYLVLLCVVMVVLNEVCLVGNNNTWFWMRHHINDLQGSWFQWLSTCPEIKDNIIGYRINVVYETLNNNTWGWGGNPTRPSTVSSFFSFVTCELPFLRRTFLENDYWLKKLCWKMNWNISYNWPSKQIKSPKILFNLFLGLF